MTYEKIIGLEGFGRDRETARRADLKIFLCCLLINTLLFFGLLTTQALLFRDDVSRSSLGYSKWASLGRPLADLFLAVIQLGTPLVNLFPLPEIIALVIISYTCLYLARSYSIRSPFFAAVCTLPLAGQPYFLQNMSYSFDAPFMALTLSFSVFAAIVLARRRKYGVEISGLLLFAVLNLYQPAVGAFFVTYMFFLIKDVNTGAGPLKYLLSRLGRLTLSSCLAFLPYIPVALMFVKGKYGLEHAGLLGPREFDGVFENTGRYIMAIASSWYGNIMGYIFGSIFLLSLIISVMRVTGKSSAGNSAGRTVIYALMSLAFGASAIILSFFPQMFLADPIIQARVFIGVGAILSCSCLLVYSHLDSGSSSPGKYRRYAAAALLCIAAYSLIVFAYAYSRAYWAQQKYEGVVIGGLLADMDRLTANKNITRLAITGNVGRSPLVENTGRKYPLIPEMVEDWNYWGLLAIGGHSLDRLDLTTPDDLYHLQSAVFHEVTLGQRETLGIIKDLRPVIHRPRYEIYLDGNLMLIRFLPLANPYSDYRSGLAAGAKQIFIRLAGRKRFDRFFHAGH